jgi:hypothetical protein
MAVSLYDMTVGTYLQVVPAVEAFMGKGLAHFKEKGIDPNQIVETRLIDDMLPFRFQVLAVAGHSLGAINGAKAGLSTPPTQPQLDYEGLLKTVTEAREGLQKVTPAEVNALEGKDVTFQIGDRKIPFVAENFLLTFSLPNFYFHATTAYDILRMKGVPLGKRDFLGRMKIKT